MLKIAAFTAGTAVAASGFLFVIAQVTGADERTYCVTQPASFPMQGVRGWRGEQLDNAAQIMRAGQALDIEHDGLVIGVMAAMGESSLRNIAYGDWETRGVTNPDGTRTSSIGLFQQQRWWGSVAERMDATTAATKFFTRLQRIPGWQDLPPSHAINRVQINSDREHYARFESDATAVVDALSGSCPTPAAR